MITTEIKFNVGAWHRSIDEWRNKSTDFDRDLMALLRRWGDKLVKTARLNAPEKTGEMKESIYYQLNEFAGRLILGSKLSRTRWQDLGTGIRSQDPNSPKEMIHSTKGETGKLRIPIGNSRNFRKMSVMTAQARYGNKPAPFRMRGVTPTTRKIPVRSNFIFRSEQKGSAPHHFFHFLLNRFKDEILSDLVMLCKKHGFL